MSLLEVKNLQVIDTLNNKEILKGVNFKLEKNQCIGIVGESGSGKSMTARAILGLINPNLKTTGEVILNEDIDLLKASKEELRKIRGQRICMILQDAMSAFDPLYTIGYQMIETLVENKNMSKQEAKQKAIKALDKVLINEPEEVIKKYPHQLSGGMLQRCMIAIAITMEPDIIIADEPTTALDCINQKEVIQQFKTLREFTVTSLIFISHDLGIVQHLAQDILVMKDGIQVEYENASQIFKNPKDKYTKYLIDTRLQLTEPFIKSMYKKEEVI